MSVVCGGKHGPFSGTTVSMSKKTKGAWVKEITYTKVGITQEDIQECKPLKKKLRAFQSFWERPKLKIGNMWTEERKETHRAQMHYTEPKHTGNKTISVTTQKREKKNKKLLREKRAAHLEKEANSLAEEVESDPFLALEKRNRPTTRAVPIQVWKNHFANILDQQQTEQAYNRPTTVNPKLQDPITKTEVEGAIRQGKNKKAAGLEQIYTEHVKQFLEGHVRYVDRNYEQMSGDRDNTGKLKDGKHEDPMQRERQYK
ncbi:hypothetical protein ANN_10152 [Periplaneta americana]|uniref:Uncharacterized protein n=1 Tax=Periplaneta americana TaxID=6978 RepID=A0ABQ8TS16_PERAM|nr:hypothetical protein ANN_10152 [Periplaneta americana]